VHDLLFDHVIERLDFALAGHLPGPTAQAVLAPTPRRDWPPGFSPAQIRNAAGLLLLFPVGGRAHIVLTVRAGTLEHHGGQVSLPGGVIESGETPERAALREAHEEIALSLDGVCVRGALTSLDIPVSGFRLHPILASTDVRPHLTPSGGEVARILEVDVSEFFDPQRLVRVDRVRDGRTLSIPLFRVGGEEIWGATAMVLAEFLAMLGWRPESNVDRT
jgi:8-oxo-dGTP pyrophosphatase MutT (NUDIX family)